MRYVKESSFPVSAEVLWHFHERPDALALLTPPWPRTEIVEAPASLEVGTRVVLRVKLGPLWQTIEAEHIAYERGRMFADRMVRGPFARWVHRHVVTARGLSESTLRDEVDYELPLGRLGGLVVAPLVRRELERLFAYRHDVTRRECLAAFVTR
ncbi:MAG: SRPBCC family protein [Labilithrix sp.]|nr:SRPBCC family protein [Labilithrix sp.]